ncbi:hypothetical protein Vretimale_5013 [Volvox reticuliferus]|uniref:C962R-like N-terminal AEP domain-containing protein n=1 Tax=Volvox reticuliferus TaxID=1737510 RepID=A0A8J4DI66_9CHLO|nr:hypothetical protein Vretifemale_4005 [Volvox reticuliferus]GIM00078.1 hypothetical protein Vretimale_5013 [Volvox reticuliferus]
MFQQLGSSARINISNGNYDATGLASRVAQARRNSLRNHYRHSFLQPPTPSRNAPPCTMRSTPSGTTTPASTFTTSHEVPPVNAEAAASSSASCSHGPQKLAVAPAPEEGSSAAPLNLLQSAQANVGASCEAGLESTAAIATTNPQAAAWASSEASAATGHVEVAATAAASDCPVTTLQSPVMENAEGHVAVRSPAETASDAEPSSSGSRKSWPGRPHSGSSAGVGRRTNSSPASTRTLPLYAEALTQTYTWPRPKFNTRARPKFLNDYPVPPGKSFNVNSFLGKGDPHRGQYLVPERSYRDFLDSYTAALEEGYQLYLTENYHQRVFKYFLEFDWDWDTDLALVMEVTPQLITLTTQIASDFYSVPYANVITSIRTPYKIHLNFPQLLTTELLACLCRDRLLEACVERLGPRYGSRVDWERLIDFPHGSLRLMGSRKTASMDKDPAWVRDKAYYPARLTEDGRWQPRRITPGLLAAASIFPQRHQVSAFERSPAYLDMIFSDLEAYQKKMEERRLERARRRAEREQQQQQTDTASREQPIPNLPPGSSKNPLYVRLEVQPDETVALKVYVKSKYRHKKQGAFYSSRASAAAAETIGGDDKEQATQQEQAAEAADGGSALAAAVSVLGVATAAAGSAVHSEAPAHGAGEGSCE